MASRFKSKKEFREVIEQVIVTVNDDTDVGPKLRDLDTSICIYFSDFDMTVNIRSGVEKGESPVVWVWRKNVKWDPVTTIEVTSNVANSFMQGKLKVAAALALRKVKVRGSLTSGLKIVAICAPMFGRYKERISEEYPHLLV